MKRYIAALLCLTAISAFGCRDGGSNSTTSSGRRTESTESLEMADGTYPVTLPLDPEVEASLHEASVSEEESLKEAAARWEAVNDAISEVLRSEEFLSAATDERKAEIVIDALKELSEHGTEKYPEPLIIAGSWSYDDEYKTVRAKYFDGLDFHADWYDYNAASTVTTKTE